MTHFKMWAEIIYSLCFIGVLINAQGTTSTKDPSPSTCTNQTDCNVPETTNDSAVTTPETIFEATTANRNSIQRATPPTSNSTISGSRNRDGTCHCDVTTFSCDINCCCDVDCKDLDVKELFNCRDDRRKVYNNRYCYDSNYIQHNQSRYLLEKLGDNLFCIVEDNLPPVYTTEYDPIISNRSTLQEIVNNNPKSRFKWDQSTINLSPQFNSDKPYRYGDVIWKIKNNYVKKLEIPQTGFTRVCSFGKALKYLENWKHSCMQISLENTNSQLHSTTFTNFTVIASPVLYNNSFFTSENQSCPRNICIPIIPHYCLDSWNSCKNEATSLSNCSNGACYNIVRGVRFIITHSGIRGIDSVNVYLKVGNASKKFYQDFEVEYKWLEEDGSKIFHLSGNRGYIPGKPIIIGNLITNTTKDKESSYIRIDKEEYSLSLPISKIDGHCSEDDRYQVQFSEDLKLSCKVELKTRNFTTNSCVVLQNRIFAALLENIPLNDTDVDKHATYVAKWNHLYGNVTDDWVKILFDRIPQNILTAQVIDDQLMCSGLVTSFRIDVVHRRLPELHVTDDYKILGVAITFSEDSDIYWDKCNVNDCTEILTIDIISYVIFHDVSKPSKYFYAEGPNLDISLPHDFFYPFVNCSPSLNSKESHSMALAFVIILVLSVSYHRNCSASVS